VKTTRGGDSAQADVAPERSAPEATMSDLIETYRGTVYPWHCDHMGHMNVMWYVGKFDEATWGLFSMLGLTPSWLRSHGRGMAALEQRLAYQRELNAGDSVVVRSAVIEVRDKVLRFAHQMRNAETGEVAATTLLVAAHLDTRQRKACALPQSVRQNALSRVAELELPWSL
jgi:acyl-CoA thioester hydrolase